MGIMVLGIAYLAVNLLTLGALLLKRYFRLFPVFCWMMGLTCWQAGVRLAFGENRAWWTPGEIVLLLATAAATVEAVADLRRMRARWRYLIMAGLAVAGGGLALWVADFPGPDLAKSFFAGRRDLFFGLGVAAFAGALYRLLWNNWPRSGRMHGWVFAILMIGHASLVSWATWGNTNMHYRWLEMTCCAGWLISLRLLGKERVESAQTTPRGAPRLHDGRRPRHGAYPPVPAGSVFGTLRGH